MIGRPPNSPLFPYPPLFRFMQRLRGDMAEYGAGLAGHVRVCGNTSAVSEHLPLAVAGFLRGHPRVADRKSTRLNSSHVRISYAVFCLHKKHDAALPAARSPR